MAEKSLELVVVGAARTTERLATVVGARRQPMTAIARLEIIPVREGSMAPAIASAVDALDRFAVSYETTATDTIIEADSVDQVFAAVQAAHEAIPDDRVITSVEIDDVRGRRQRVDDRVASVERALGRPPRRIQEPPRQETSRQPATMGSGRPAETRRRYGGSSKQARGQQSEPITSPPSTY